MRYAFKEIEVAAAAYSTLHKGLPLCFFQATKWASL